MYQHHWDTFQVFQNSVLKHTQFPATPHTLALFIVHLAQRQLAVTTIRTYVSAVSFIHKLNSVSDPGDSFLVAKTLQGLHNQHSQQRRCPLRPITRDILYSLLDHIPMCTTSPYYTVMWTALFQLCYHACLRVGEAVLSANKQHTLRLDQLQLSHNQLTVKFETFKHSSHSTPALNIQPDSNPERCPITALLRYKSLRPNIPGPFFVDHTSSPINRNAFSAFLKTVLAAANFQPDHFNTHSFRIGRTTQLAQDNHNTETIRAVGRWKSSAYTQYIRSSSIDLPK